MKKNKSFFLQRLSVLCFVSIVLSCSSDSPDNSEPNENTQYYSLGVVLGEDYTNYLLSTDNLLEGNISPVGNGTEILGSEYIQSGDYIYFFSRSDKKFYQYKLNVSGTVTEEASLLLQQYISDRAYSQNLLDDNTILIMDPIVWGGTEIKWLTISIPDFVIKDYGTYSLPTLQKTEGVNWNSNVGKAVLHGDKIIMGTVYYDFDNNFSEGTHAIVLDYPSMSNPTLIDTNLTDAELGIFTNNNFITTQKGDLYIVGYRGAYGKSTDDNVHGVVFRIKAGEYDFDETYMLDFTQKIGETTQIMQLDFLEGETAMAMLFNDTGVVYENLDDDHYYYAKIDLENQTVSPYNMPKSDIRLARKPLVIDGKYISFIKSAANNTTRVLEIDYNGGADDYIEGISIAGENIQGYSIVKHPTP